MNYADLSALGILLFSVGMGFMRGLIWELLKYISLGIAALLAVIVAYYSMAFFSDPDSGLIAAAIIGFFVFLVVSAILLGLVNKISKSLSKTSLGYLDKLLGSVFGAVRAAAFVMFLYSGLMIVTMNQQPDWLRGSVLLGPLEKGNVVVQGLLNKFATPKLKRLLKLEQISALIKLGELARK